jgi:hypothetical protein
MLQADQAITGSVEFIQISDVTFQWMSVVVN